MSINILQDWENECWMSIYSQDMMLLEELW